MLSVEAQLAWLPVAYPLRKECYTLVRNEEGVVSVHVPDGATVSSLDGVGDHRRRLPLTGWRRRTR